MQNQSSTSEQLLWQGNPSHLIYFKVYLFCVLTCFSVIPIFVAVWHVLKIKATKYELTSQRLRFYTGVLNREINEVELYRVRDYNLQQPFVLRMFGCSNLNIITSDATNKVIILQAITDGEVVREQLRHAVEDRRTNRQVRTLDMDGYQN